MTGSLRIKPMLAKWSLLITKCDRPATMRSGLQSGNLGNPVVTEIVPLEKFYEAEPEHWQFYKENPESMYCQIVISPKVAKLRERFAGQLR